MLSPCSSIWDNAFKIFSSPDVIWSCIQSSPPISSLLGSSWREFHWNCPLLSLDTSAASFLWRHWACRHRRQVMSARNAVVYCDQQHLSCNQWQQLLILLILNTHANYLNGIVPSYIASTESFLNWLSEWYHSRFCYGCPSRVGLTYKPLAGAWASLTCWSCKSSGQFDQLSAWSLSVRVGWSSQLMD